MLVTITEYKNAASGPNGQDLALGSAKGFVAVQNRTDAGTRTLDAATKLIRVATDTNITIDPNGTAELVVAGESWFQVEGGEELTIATVA